MTTPEAIEAVKKGQPVPSGTHFVLVDYREGEVFRYFVMQKGDGWAGNMTNAAAPATAVPVVQADKTVNIGARTPPAAS